MNRYLEGELQHLHRYKSLNCNIVFFLLHVAPISLVTSTFSSALTTNSLKYSPPHQPTPNHYYELTQVLVGTTGDYTFQSNSTINLYGYLYKNSFNAKNPSMNLITSDNNSGGNKQFLFTASLQLGVVYILLVTTYNANVTGSYIVNVSGPSNVIFVSIVPTTTTSTTINTTPSTTAASISEYYFLIADCCLDF